MTSQPYAAGLRAVTRLSQPFYAAADTARGGTSSRQQAVRPAAMDGPPPPYQRLLFRLTGVAPLVMHSGRMADPLNPMSRALKRVSGKRMKTDADYEELARIEFLGSLYVGDDGPCIPGEVVEAALVQAARKMRKGIQATAGIISDTNHRLDYDGPREPDKLWDDERFRLSVGVRIQRNRVIRTRPIFRAWSSDIFVDVLPGQLNPAEVDEMVRICGEVVGIGDWRPRFGRFTAERL